MISYHSYHSGAVYGMLYEFGLKGDHLKEHDHKPPRDDPHNVICLSGAVLVIGPEINRRVNAGEIFEFDSLKRHAIVAIEPNSRTLHLYTNGRPSDFIEDFVGEI